MPRTLYADALGFLSSPLSPQIADADLPENLALMHLTAANPLKHQETEAIAAAVANYRASIISQKPLALVTDQDSLKAALEAEDKTGMVLGLQHPPNDCSLKNLELLWDLGVRIIAIAYEEVNNLGAGWAHHTAGLTEVGAQFLRDCSRIGFILDLSHSGHVTAGQALAQILSEKLPLPVMASHGGAYAVHDSLRNLPDYLMRLIVELGGIVGLFTLTFDLDTKDRTITPFLRHLKHMRQVCGSEALALGSDAVYRTRDTTQWIEEFRVMQQNFDSKGKRGSKWPDFPIQLNSVKRCELLEKIILKSGHDEQFVSDFLGGTFLGFLRTHLPR